MGCRPCSRRARVFAVNPRHAARFKERYGTSGARRLTDEEGRALLRIVPRGSGHDARVVTAAAVIMTAVFAGFDLTDDPTMKSIGFALAVGVLIDAFIVRMPLVPAAMSFLGRTAWWLPRPLDRALPNLDIEGERLQKRLAHDPHTEPKEPTTV